MISVSKTALITGAGRGIGRAIAIMLAKQGIHLALAGRDKKALDETIAMVKEYGVEAIEILADNDVEETPKFLIKSVIEKYNRLDILINNAGYAINKSFEQHTINDWNAVMICNARAPFFITQEALPYLKKSGKGMIINISSAVGRLGYADQSAYTASKHALMGWTKALAKEVQKDNIRVHVIAPGGVATEMISKMRPDINPAELMQVEEIADIVKFLISFEGNAMIDEINVRRFSSSPWQ